MTGTNGRCAVAGVAVAKALQDVNGIALKTMVNIWAAASLAQKEMAFHRAAAVRLVGRGLSQYGLFPVGALEPVSASLCVFSAHIHGARETCNDQQCVSDNGVRGDGRCGFSSITTGMKMPDSFLQWV